MKKLNWVTIQFDTDFSALFSLRSALRSSIYHALPTTLIPWCVLVCSVLFSPPILSEAASALESVPLVIKERAGLDRLHEPVSYGVPLDREENITTTAGLGIFNSNDEEIDAQFTVLSRYDGLVSDNSQPIRSVLVSFFVDGLNSNSELTYYLKNSGSGTTSGDNLVTEDSSQFLIDTGTLTVKISKTNFNLFDEVILGTETIVSSNPTDGIVLIDVNGGLYSSNNAPDETVIEENGPIKAVIKIKGKFKNTDESLLIPEFGDNGASYTVRFTFFKGKTFVKVDYSLENENLGWSGSDSNPIHNLWLESNYLKTTLANATGNKTVSFSGYSDNSENSSYQLTQTEDSDATTSSYDWNYTIKKDGIEVHSGSKYDAYMDLKDTTSNMGLMMASRRFWQNHPKGLEAINNEVRFNVFPKSDTAHRFLGGIWKTTELIYYFHDSSDTNFDNELATLKKRLILKGSDEYYASTGFFSAMVPENIVTGHTFPAGEQMQKAIEAQKKELRSRFNLSFTDTAKGETLFSLRDKRNILIDTDNYGSWYGWLEFGDFVRGNGYGYSATHYSWPYISLKAFLRFNDYDALELGEELVSHAADISILHDPSATEMMDSRYHGAHRYETDALFSFNDTYTKGQTGNVRASSHFWNRGLILQYLLTGDRRYFDAAQDSVDHLEKVYINDYQCRPDATDPTACKNYDALRSKGRAVHGLVSFYQLTGNSQHLDNSWNIFKYGVLGHAKTYDQDGVTYTYYSDSAREDKPAYSALQSGITLEGVIELHEIFTELGNTERAAELALYLEQNALFMRDVIYKTWVTADCGTYGEGAYEDQYFPYGQKKLWYPGDVWNDDEVCQYCGNYGNYYAPYLADMFAFQYKETNDIGWLNLARMVFKDFFFYTLVAEYYDIAYDPKEISAFTNLGSAWAKFGQRYKKGMYYLKTEWQESQKNISAFFTASPNPAEPGETITFDGSSSTGSITSYHWDFDNDQVIDATGEIVTHSYSDEGSYYVTLTVGDGTETSSTARTITVAEFSCIPSTEICSDGIDQDCDGVDEVCQSCGPGEITSRCNCGTSIGVEFGYCCEGSWQTSPCVTSCIPDCSSKSCGDDNGCGEPCVVQSCNSEDFCSDSAQCIEDIREISYIHPTCIGSSQYTGVPYDSTNCFSSLAAWHSAKKEDLVIAGKIAIAQIEGNWEDPDKASLYISGWVTDSDHYIEIRTSPEARHSGAWSNTKYRLQIDNGTIFYINEDNVRIDGLQLFSTYNGNHSHGFVLSDGDDTLQDLRFSNNLIRGHGNYDDEKSHFAFTTAGGDPVAGSTATIWNNIIYDFAGPTGGSGLYAQKATRTYLLYNNTFYNCSNSGISVAAATTIARNNLIAGSTNAYTGTFADPTDYNATDINDVPGKGSFNLTLQQFVFKNEDPTNLDLHLTVESDGRNSGVNTASRFFADIDGDLRNYGNCDIGADEWVSTKLLEAILILQALTNSETQIPYSLPDDIDGDQQIGLAEAISALIRAANELETD